MPVNELSFFNSVKKQREGLAYLLYQIDWCMERNLDVKNTRNLFVKDLETSEGMFVCFDEFLENEYEDKRYISYLFSEKFFKKIKKYL